MVSYNEEPYIKESLLSLLGQSYTDFELLVCDNGSKDQTLEIVKRFMKADSRIKLFTERKNKGALYNFKKARDLADGKFFAWVAGHDIYSENWLELLLIELETDQSLAYVYAKTVGFDEQSKRIAFKSDTINSAGLTTNTRLTKPYDVVMAGSRVYGLQRLEKTKKVFVPVTPFWDRLYLSLVNCVGCSKVVERATFYRRYSGGLFGETLPSDILNRQLKMLFTHYPPGRLNCFPSFKNLFLLFFGTMYLAKDVEIWTRFKLAWNLIRRYRIGVSLGDQITVYRQVYRTKA